MRLFHGTNIDFKEIDFQKCKPNKDFGKGFYLLEYKKLNSQYFFGTEKAISKLKRIWH